MEILDLQQRSLEFLDEVHNQSLMDRILGGATQPALVAAGTTSAFLVADLGGNFSTTATSRSFASVGAGTLTGIDATIGSVINITALLKKP